MLGRVSDKQRPDHVENKADDGGRLESPDPANAAERTDGGVDDLTVGCLDSLRRFQGSGSHGSEIVVSDDGVRW